MEREQATKFIYDLLRALVAKKGSDLFITAGFPPAMKIDGKMTPVSQQALSAQHTAMLVRAVMNDKQAAEFEAKKECNFAIAPASIGRFRVNCFVQMGATGMVLRVITTTIPNFDDLKLPPVLKDVAMTKRGLVIFVGGTGSGKSTSLAAMIGYRNENSHGHIITIEDPVEYAHKSRQSLVTHREVGVDTHSWHKALKNALRQAPDVILIGEIRDKATMAMGLAYAQSGHLAVATLHANNSYHAMNRVINFYPLENRPSLLLDMAAALQSIISQRLVRTKVGTRKPAVEVMMNTRHISELIEKGEVNEIKDAMEKSMAPGSQTFEQALFKLFMDGTITQDEAMANADSASNMLWLINQATAGEISGQSAPAPTASTPAAPKKEEEEKKGVLSAGGGASFSNFKIDMNA